MEKTKKIKRSVFSLVLYYLLFNIYIQFPYGHSLVYDLYEGRVNSYVVLEGNNGREASPSGLLDHHRSRVVNVEQCLLCTIHDRFYPQPLGTVADFLCIASVEQPALFLESLHPQPPSTTFNRRAPPLQQA